MQTEPFAPLCLSFPVGTRGMRILPRCFQILQSLGEKHLGRPMHLFLYFLSQTPRELNPKGYKVLSPRRQPCREALSLLIPCSKSVVCPDSLHRPEVSLPSAPERVGVHQLSLASKKVGVSKSPQKPFVTVVGTRKGFLFEHQEV